jgi:ribosome biogenesis SPOUT family RNA methylase Rps3
MEPIRQIYEKLPEVITVPDELRDRRVEVILLPLDEEPDVAALAAELGLKPEDIADLHALRFAGCLPDFPPRAPQGEYEVREELKLE